MFRALQCPLSGARHTAVAASGFRMNVEVEVFSAVVGLLVGIWVTRLFKIRAVLYFRTGGPLSAVRKVQFGLHYTSATLLYLTTHITLYSGVSRGGRKRNARRYSNFPRVDVSVLCVAVHKRFLRTKFNGRAGNVFLWFTGTRQI